MKKIFKLTPIALATLFSIQANADTTVYGVGHISFDSVDYAGGTSGSGLASNSSRLGFKGSNEVKNGLSAIYQFETGVDVSGRSGSDGNGGGVRKGQLFTNARDSFVGLSGSFGKILGGRLGVENQWLYDCNLFGDQVGDLGNFWGMPNGMPGRANGVLAYASPNMGHLNFVVAYKGDDSKKNTAATVAKVNINFSGLKIGLGYAGLGKGIYSATNDVTTTAITGSYDLKVAKVVGGYQTVSNYNGGNKNQSSWTFGTAFPMGTATLKAQYMSLTDDAISANATGYALGVDYAVTKGATAYIAYSATNNDTNAKVPADSWGHGNLNSPTAGNSPTALSVGLVYKFNAKVF